MSFDIKQKVLFCIYIEYQKNNPQLVQNITAEVFGIENDDLSLAFDRLTNEENIKGLAFVYDGKLAGGDILPTLKAIELIEKYFNIDPMWSGIRKIEELKKAFVENNDTMLINYVDNALISIEPKYIEFLKSIK